MRRERWTLPQGARPRTLINLITNTLNERIENSPVEDFDWDAYENGESNIGRSRDELTHAYEESLNSIKDKEVIEGTIIALNKREAVVNIDLQTPTVSSP